jgi:hypothetical protein
MVETRDATGMGTLLASQSVHRPAKSGILIYWTLAKITYGKTFDEINTPGEWTQRAFGCRGGVLAPWHDGRREEE